jgi:hypothetical protein
MVDNKYRKSSEIIEEIEKCAEKRYQGCDLQSLLFSLVKASTQETVSERAPKALPILDELIKRLEEEHYSQQFIGSILLAIEDYANKYIQPGDHNYEYNVDKFIDGLKYLLKDRVLGDIYETYILILEGEFENPYSSAKERYKRYYEPFEIYKYGRLTLNFPSLFSEGRLSIMRKEQARDYIHMGIEALMHSPDLGMSTVKNRLESYPGGIYWRYNRNI